MVDFDEGDWLGQAVGVGALGVGVAEAVGEEELGGADVAPSCLTEEVMDELAPLCFGEGVIEQVADGLNLGVGFAPGSRAASSARHGCAPWDGTGF